MLKGFVKTMKLNIMTWNTQLYEYGNKIGNKKKKIEDSKFDPIMEFVDKHLEKENSIVVLQEIPYKSNVTWEKHELFRRFREKYDANEYDVIFNVSSRSQIKMTVVLAKKGLIDRISNKNNNCYVSFKIIGTDISALAVHSHNAFECREYIRNDVQNKYNLILGDFNAGNYIKKEKDEEIAINRQNYLLLLEGYIDICQGEYTTIYTTFIDHILLASDYDFLMVHKCLNLNVCRDVKLSDHYPIVFELSISDNEKS